VFLSSANYIKVQSNLQSSSSAFQAWLDTMIAAGVVAKWSGIFKEYSCDNIIQTTSREQQNVIHNNELFTPSSDQMRYVGYPSMSSICRHLVNDVKINSVFNQRIKAYYGKMNRKWTIVDIESDKVLLNDIDWLISTDQ